MKKTLITLSIAGLCALPLATQAGTYKETSVSNGGTISGTINFKGKDLPPKTYTISKDNDVCGTGERKIDFVRVKDGHLLDTIVYLEKVKEGKPFPADVGDVGDVGDAIIDQKGCEFKPFLQAMKNKDVLDAVNDDPILHNIHTYELIRGDAKGPKKTVMNISQPKPGSVKTTIKLKKGPAMKIASVSSAS